MRRIVSLAACACCAAATAAAAQNRGMISGVVTDAATGAPIAGALVRLVETHREEPLHEDGRFSFSGLGAGNWTLLVRAIGYRPRTERVRLAGADTVRLRLSLEPAVIQLAPTVVTGTIGERSSADVLSPTSVVSGAELDRRLGATIGATLADAPGLAVSSLGPATARPVIRGLGGDRILILEDGMRPGDLSSTNADHAVAIDPVSARQVEVVRGPMGLLYGSSALGGVVNVIREEIPTSLPDHLHGELSLSGSAFTAGATGSGWLTARAGRVALRAEASGRRSGNVRTPDARIAGTDATTVSFSGGAALIGGTSHSGLSYRYYSNDYGVPGGFTGGHATNVTISMKRHMLRAETERHRPGAALSLLRASAAFSDYRHDELEPAGSVGTAYLMRTGVLDLQARNGGEGTRQGALGARAQLRSVETGGTLRTPSTRDWSIAGYAVQEVPLGAVRLQAGLRYDVNHYEPGDTTAFVTAGGQRIPVRPRTFGALSGSLGLLWSASDELRLGANVSRAFRTPDFNELYSNGPHLAANSFDVGDPSLSEETGLGMEVFLRWHDRAFRGEGALFINRLSDFVFPSSRGRAELGAQGNRPRFQYTNADARFVGAEGDFDLRVSRVFGVNATVSWVRAVFIGARDSIPVITPTDTSFIAASRNPPLIPPLHGRLGLRAESRRWFATVGLRWSGEQRHTGDFETPTAAWATADLAAGLRILSGSRFHAITVRVDNLADAAYRDHLDRLKEIQLQPGRTVSVLYRVSF